MSKKRKKRIRLIIIISIIIFVIVGIVLSKNRKETKRVSTELVEKRTIIETVSASGKIQPEVEVKITPDVSGEVVELFVKEGDKVSKGDLLAKINPDIYASNLDRMGAGLNTQKANLANTRARLAQSQSQLIKAEKEYNRNKGLWEKKIISDSEYEAVKASYEVAKSEVTAGNESVNASRFNVYSSMAALKEAKDNLTKTSIFAPIDGTISKLSIEKGERVVGTSQFEGTEIMRVANLTEMEVNVDVSENDIVRVTKGDTCFIEVDAYHDRKFAGIVTEIANSANVLGVNTDQVTNFEVKIRILRDSYKDLVDRKSPNLSPFRPGMSATVEIKTETVENVLSVPIQAVTTRIDSTDIKFEMKNIGEEKMTSNNEVEEIKEYLFIYSEGQVKLVEVKSGIQDNYYIQIIKGIKEKAEVVVAPYTAINKELEDEMNVNKVDKKDLFEHKGKK